MKATDIWEYTLQRDFGDKNTCIYVHHVTDEYMVVELRMRVRPMLTSQVVVEMGNIDLRHFKNRGVVIAKFMHGMKRNLWAKVGLLRINNVKRAQKSMKQSIRRKRVAAKLRGRK